MSVHFKTIGNGLNDNNDCCYMMMMLVFMKENTVDGHDSDIDAAAVR
jgi:hypothetical protein